MVGFVLLMSACSSGGGGGDGGGGDGAPGGSSAPAPEACAAPTFTPGEGTFSADQNVVIGTTTTGATIHYTTNGDAPTTSSPTYSAPIAVAGNGTVRTIKAIAVKDGMSNSAVSTGTFTINYSQVSTPQFSPVAGTYSSTQSVSIACGTSGATIRYTTDGSTPTSGASGHGTIGGGPISVSANMTIKAIAYKSGMTDSTVAEAGYVIKIAAPAFAPAGGTKSEDTTVTLTQASADDIYYTIATGTVASPPSDPADPTTSSTKYTGAIMISGHNTVAKIKAIAVKCGMGNSDVASATYTINYAQVATPTFDKAAGWYTPDQSVVISCATPGVSIRYTVKASEIPTSTFGTLISSGDSTTPKNHTYTLRAIAYKAGMLDSTVLETTYYVRRAIIAGSYHNGTDTDWMIKVFDDKGNEDTSWSKIISNAGKDNITSVAVDSNNNVYVAGFSNHNSGTNYGDGKIRKYSHNGVEVTAGWPKTFVGKAFAKKQVKIAIDAANNIYAIHADSIDWSGSSVAATKVIKYAPGGSESWNVVVNSGYQIGTPDRRPDHGFDVRVHPWWPGNMLFIVGQSVNYSAAEPEKAKLSIIGLHADSCTTGNPVWLSGWPMIINNPGTPYNYSHGKKLIFNPASPDINGEFYILTRQWNESPANEYTGVKKFRFNGEVASGWDKTLDIGGHCLRDIAIDTNREYVFVEGLKRFTLDGTDTGMELSDSTAIGTWTSEIWIGREMDNDWNLTMYMWNDSDYVEKWNTTIDGGSGCGYPCDDAYPTVIEFFK